MSGDLYGRDAECLHIRTPPKLPDVGLAERQQPLTTTLKLFSFFGFDDAGVSQFVSQSVSQYSGRPGMPNL